MRRLPSTLVLLSLFACSSTDPDTAGDTDTAADTDTGGDADTAADSGDTDALTCLECHGSQAMLLATAKPADTAEEIEGTGEG